MEPCIAPAPVPAAAKATFEESYPEVSRLVNARRHSWTYLSIMEWSDVSQLLTIHIWEKWHQYDPTKSSKQNPERALEKWVNTVITRQLLNLRRDLVLRLSRPCIGGGKANGKRCTFNMGADACNAPWVKSKTQCAECPLYAEWEKTRQHQLFVKSNVSLEYHAQEVNNVQGDFADIDGVQTKLHEEMLSQLTRWESLIYRCLFIRHLSAAETVKVLEKAAARRKGPLQADELTSYQSVLAARRHFTEMMLLVLKRDGHVDPSYVLKR